MLKNKIWIVALIAVLAITFIGCSDGLGYGENHWKEPTGAYDENALYVKPKANWAGVDFNHNREKPKDSGEMVGIKFAVGDVIQLTGQSLGANQLALGISGHWPGTSGSNLDPVWNKTLEPNEEFDSGKITLTATHIAGLQDVVDTANKDYPATLRVRGNTANAAFVIINFTVTRGTKEIYNLAEYLATLEEGETDYKVIFASNNLSEASSDGAQADFKILGPNSGGESEDVKVQEYKGNSSIKDKIIVVDDHKAAGKATRVGNTIIDFDPIIVGSGNVTIDKEGNATFTGGEAKINYLFPTEAIIVKNENFDYDSVSGTYTFTPELIAGSRQGTRDTKTVAVEKDYDYVQINYEITDLVGATNAKFQLVQYGSANNTSYPPGYRNDVESRTFEKFQTWDSGDKGGVSIRLNADGAATGFTIKIKSVVITTGVRHKVEFFVPQLPNLNDIKAIEVLSGNPLAAQLPKAPKNPGWTFLGWYTTWTANNASTTPITLATIIDNIISDPGDIGDLGPKAPTNITSDIKLFAAFIREILDPLVDDVADALDPDGTLFSAKWIVNGSWGNSANTLGLTTYKGKKWYLVHPWEGQNNGTGYESLGPWEIGEGADKITVPAVAGTPGGDVGIYSLTLPTGWDNGYNKVKITYDLVMLEEEKSAPVALLNPASPWSAYDTISLEEGNDKTLVFNIAGSLSLTSINIGTFGFREHGYYGSGAGAFLWRVTKIEVYIE